MSVYTPTVEDIAILKQHNCDHPLFLQLVEAVSCYLYHIYKNRWSRQYNHDEYQQYIRIRLHDAIMHDFDPTRCNGRVLPFLAYCVRCKIISESLHDHRAKRGETDMHILEDADEEVDIAVYDQPYQDHENDIIKLADIIVKYAERHGSPNLFKVRGSKRGILCDLKKLLLALPDGWLYSNQKRRNKLRKDGIAVKDRGVDYGRVAELVNLRQKQVDNALFKLRSIVKSHEREILREWEEYKYDKK